MGFGHRVYRAEDPRARVLRRTCRELKAPRYEVAVALEQAALAELRERRPDHPIETNVEFWAAVILDFAEVPPHMMPAMFTSARTAGWSAHILEQKREAKLVRPSAPVHRPWPPPPRGGRGLGRDQPRLRSDPRTAGQVTLLRLRPEQSHHCCGWATGARRARTRSESRPATTHSAPPTYQATS